MKRHAWIALTCLLAATACGDNDNGSGDDDDDGDGGGETDAGPMDAGADDAGADAGAGDVERGRYLVEVVGACTDCHTPRNQDGSPDMTRFLGGNESFADIDPEDDTMGNLPAPNLTSDPTGLADWGNEDIKNAFLNGIDAEAEGPRRRWSRSCRTTSCTT
jgi:hypothetical protein